MRAEFNFCRAWFCRCSCRSRARRGVIRGVLNCGIQCIHCRGEHLWIFTACWASPPARRSYMSVRRPSSGTGVGLGLAGRHVVLGLLGARRLQIAVDGGKSIGVEGFHRPCTMRWRFGGHILTKLVDFAQATTYMATCCAPRRRWAGARCWWCLSWRRSSKSCGTAPTPCRFVWASKFWCAAAL